MGRVALAPTLWVTSFTLPKPYGFLVLLSLIFLRHKIKDSGYNNNYEHKQAAIARLKYACTAGYLTFNNLFMLLRHLL